MIYMDKIKCKYCKKTTNYPAGTTINFCWQCGKFMNEIDASGEQPFHLPEKVSPESMMAMKSIDDLDALLKSKNNFPDILIKNLIECKKILEEIVNMDGTRRKTGEMLGIVKKKQEKQQKLMNLSISDMGEDMILKKPVPTESDILSDPKWYQKLKALKF